MKMEHPIFEVSLVELQALAQLFRRLDSWINKGRPHWTGVGASTIMLRSLTLATKKWREIKTVADLLIHLRDDVSGTSPKVEREMKTALLSTVKGLMSHLDKKNYILPEYFSIGYLWELLPAPLGTKLVAHVQLLEEAGVNTGIESWSYCKLMQVLPEELCGELLPVFDTLGQRPLYVNSVYLHKDFPGFEAPMLTFSKTEVERIRKGIQTKKLQGGFRVPPSPQERRMERVTKATKEKSTKAAEGETATAAMSKILATLNVASLPDAYRKIVSLEDGFAVLQRRNKALEADLTRHLEQEAEFLNKLDVLGAEVAEATARAQRKSPAEKTLDMVRMILDLDGDPRKVVTILQKVCGPTEEQK